MNPQPGEVWLADLGLAAKTRPVVIVSRHDPDPPRALNTISTIDHATGRVPMKWHYHGSAFSTVTRSQMSKGLARCQRCG